MLFQFSMSKVYVITMSKHIAFIYVSAYIPLIKLVAILNSRENLQTDTEIAIISGSVGTNIQFGVDHSVQIEHGIDSV